MTKIDVFISHSHKDKTVADAICHYFENDAIKCWIAPRDITPGSTWAHSIASAIPDCKIMLLIFSSYSNMSDQVLREVELAVSEKLIIVPVKIEDIMPTGGMKYYLSTLHWIDAVNKKTEKYILSLTESIKGFLNNEKRLPLPVKNKAKKKIKPSLIWLSAVVVFIAVLGIVFKDSLFREDSQSLDASVAQPTDTIEITEAPIAEPTAAPTNAPTEKPTAVPTAEPTATIEPNISLDTVVEIPDIGLKTAILKTLDEQGDKVNGNITVGDMQKLTTLAIVSPEDEVGFGDTDVTLNSITMNTQINTLEGLQYASNLRAIGISGVGLKDISALSQIYNLEYVDLSYNNIEDISSLSNNNKIKELCCNGNNISDITALILLYNIEKLDISYNPISSLKPLKDMSELNNLWIRDMSISSFNGIEDLKNLMVLNAQDNNLTDISSLEKLVNLERLVLINCGLNDLSSLSTLNNLKELDLNDNNITGELTFLLELNNLEYVNIDLNVYNKNEEIFEDLINAGCDISNTKRY